MAIALSVRGLQPTGKIGSGGLAGASGTNGVALGAGWSADCSLDGETPEGDFSPVGVPSCWVEVAFAGCAGGGATSVLMGGLVGGVVGGVNEWNPMRLAFSACCQ